MIISLDISPLIAFLSGWFLALALVGTLLTANLFFVKPEKRADTNIPERGD